MLDRETCGREEDRRDGGEGRLKSPNPFPLFFMGWVQEDGLKHAHRGTSMDTVIDCLHAGGVLAKGEGVRMRVNVTSTPLLFAVRKWLEL